MSTMQERQETWPVSPPGSSRRSFAKEFKADAVALVLDEGRSIASVARALGIGEANLGNWVRQARVDRGEGEGRTTGERAELAKLRRRHLDGSLRTLPRPRRRSRPAERSQP